MFIARHIYDELRDAKIRAEAVATALQSHNTALHATMDWMKMRLTQSEHERAALIHNYTGVKIVVPSIEDEKPQTGINQILNDAVAMFQDVGDTEALAQNIGWNEDGTVKYGN
jgi:hypothetical protein